MPDRLTSLTAHRRQGAGWERDPRAQQPADQPNPGEREDGQRFVAPPQEGEKHEPSGAVVDPDGAPRTPGYQSAALASQRGRRRTARHGCCDQLRASAAHTGDVEDGCQTPLAGLGEGRLRWWAQTVSNRRPLPCKGSALPLSYAPARARRSGPYALGEPTAYRVPRPPPQTRAGCPVAERAPAGCREGARGGQSPGVRAGRRTGAPWLGAVVPRGSRLPVQPAGGGRAACDAPRRVGEPPPPCRVRAARPCSGPGPRPRLDAGPAPSATGGVRRPVGAAATGRPEPPPAPAATPGGHRLRWCRRELPPPPGWTARPG